MTLKLRLNDDMKNAMRSGDTVRRDALRLLLAAIKQKEVDERIELDDTAVLNVIEKALKQRKDSITQYQAANRQDLIAIEESEVAVFSSYMPQALSTDEINAIIQAAIAQSGAKVPADMGKVVGLVKPQVAGRADMGEVSKLIKAALA
ncbi:MAG TPA: GatB/YqeY domain-containing protein [Rhodocyclaceae bacterium]|nr:GatB/YqeY domain-containing protein [Rhodocyclaceae bacterium]